MQKRSSIIHKFCALCLSFSGVFMFISCVTPSQRDEMKSDISALENNVNILNKQLNVQTKQTERTMKNTLSSQTELQQLQASIAENAGELDTLKMRVKRIEEVGSQNLESYKASIEGYKKEVDTLQKRVALLEAKTSHTEKAVSPSKTVKDSFQPKSAKDVNKTLKEDYEKGQFKTVVLKSSMVIQSTQSKPDMIETALKFRGEAKYKLSDYSGAVVDLTHYVENYPKAEKRARALLLIGDSYVFFEEKWSCKILLFGMHPNFSGFIGRQSLFREITETLSFEF